MATGQPLAEPRVGTKGTLRIQSRAGLTHHHVLNKNKRQGTPFSSWHWNCAWAISLRPTNQACHLRNGIAGFKHSKLGHRGIHQTALNTGPVLPSMWPQHPGPHHQLLVHTEQAHTDPLQGRQRQDICRGQALLCQQDTAGEAASTPMPMGQGWGDRWLPRLQKRHPHQEQESRSNPIFPSTLT